MSVALGDTVYLGLLFVSFLPLVLSPLGSWYLSRFIRDRRMRLPSFLSDDSFTCSFAWFFPRRCAFACKTYTLRHGVGALHAARTGGSTTCTCQCVALAMQQRNRRSEGDRPMCDPEDRKHVELTTHHSMPSQSEFLSTAYRWQASGW
jgi:hypothetical protein